MVKQLKFQTFLKAIHLKAIYFPESLNRHISTLFGNMLTDHKFHVAAPIVPDFVVQRHTLEKTNCAAVTSRKYAKETMFFN
jgi:hypothetical protein